MKNLEDLAKFPSENPNPVLRVTKNKVLYVNKAGELLLSIKEGDKIPKLFQGELTEALNKNILKTLEVEIDNLIYILDITPIKEEGYANIYGRNITERKKAEQKLKESEVMYRTLIENAQEGIWTIDENSITSFVNPRMAEMLGYAQDEMLGKHLFDFMDEKSIEIANRNIERRKQGIEEQHDFEFLRKNGTKIYTLLATSPLMDEEGNYKGAVAFVSDITERKRIEEELRENERLLKNAQEIAQIGHGKINLSTMEISGSDKFFKIIGLTHDEVTLKQFSEVVHPEDREMYLCYFRKCIEKGRSYDIEHRVICENGTEKWVHALGEAIKDDDGKVIMLMGTMQNITKRKKTELKLKESEEKYKNLFEQSPMAIILISFEGIIEDCNTPTEVLFGYTKEELLGKEFIKFDNFPLDSKLILVKSFSKFLKTGVQQHHDIKMYRKDGKIIWINSYPINVKIAEKSYILVVIQDITERKKTEQILEESQKKYKLLSEELELILDHILGLVFYKDTKNNFIWVNKYMADAHKMKREDLIGKSMFEVYPEELAQAYWDDDLEVINSGKPKLNIEEPWDTADGLKWVLTSKIPYIDENGDIKGIIGTSVDITERRIAEIELQKSELTYREAYNRAEFYKDIFTHDINNILQNISNGIQLNEMYLNKPDKLNKIKRNIDIIKRQVRRGANLVSNVRKLSKIAESETSLFNVNCIEVLKKSINYIKNAFADKNIKIEFQIIENNYKILANELLEDVFENILTNSINYNDSKVINIEVKVTKELRQEINNIKMQFSDNGIGITDERKQNIFIRGYSEETSVHGMGLGLSLVKKIIESYNGEIWMEDRVKGDYTKGNNCIVLIQEVVNNG